MVSERNHINGLKKGLSVIECFDDTNQKLTISEVAQRTGLSRASARRCLLTLVDLGYASADRTFFSLTHKVLRLGFSYLSSASLPQILQRQIEELGEETRESCAAALLDGTEVLYIAKSTAKRVLASGVNIGGHLPAFCTSTGRVLLAELPPEEAQKCLKAAKRPRLTPHTITKVDELMKLLPEIHKQGYCLVEEELEVGLISLSVPVYNNTGTAVAALNIGTNRQKFDGPALLKNFLSKLQAIQEKVAPLIH